VADTRFGGLFSGRLCTHEGETTFQDIYGVSHTVPWTCAGTNYHGGTYAGGKAFRGINNIGDAVGVFTPGVYRYQTSYPSYPWVWLLNSEGGRDEYDANDLLPPDSGYTVLSVSDINDKREIVGTCEDSNGEQRGCILHVTEPAIPLDMIKPRARIDAPDASEKISGVTTINVSAWDQQSRMRKVIFKIDGAVLARDKTRPYSVDWDTGSVSPGEHEIRVVAIDRAGNRKTRVRLITVIDGDAGLPRLSR